MHSKKKSSYNFIYQHFRLPGHSFYIQPVQQLSYDINAGKKLRTTARLIAEHEWIKKLQTPFPLGLNDNMYHFGNISKDPSIDIFSIFSIRKRKSRSHGLRKNGNIKRKSRLKLNVLELHNLFVNAGKHRMLSRLSSLSITSLREIDKEADQIVLRTHPHYKTASLIQSYTQHVLRPHIDSDSDHKKLFLKIPFINKGIDFIDLQSILRDRNVLKSIPSYFKNSETPIICYKYNKPIRGLIFNYNKIVSDLNIHCSKPTS